MATKKDTTTKATAKSTATPDVNKELQEQLLAMQKQMEAMQKALAEKDKEVEQVKAESEKVKTQSKQLDRNRRVPVRSVTEGGLTYVSSATGLSTTWASFGSEHYMEVEELIRMKSSQPAFLTLPYLVVDDEDVIEYLSLKDTYDKIIPVDELDAFFNKNVEEIEAILRKAPKGTKRLVATRARKLVESGELDSIKVKNKLQEVLEIDLSMVED
jgi:hypothetical protein